jgi:hypothetical protein
VFIVTKYLHSPRLLLSIGCGFAKNKAMKQTILKILISSFLFILLTSFNLDLALYQEDGTLKITSQMWMLILRENNQILKTEYTESTVTIMEGVKMIHIVSPSDASGLYKISGKSILQNGNIIYWVSIDNPKTLSSVTVNQSSVECSFMKPYSTYIALSVIKKQ